MQRAFQLCVLVSVAAALLALQVGGPARCAPGCHAGSCVNGSCVCHHGWVGERCQHCQGRFKLSGPSGWLSDGPTNYKYKTKCTWLIEGFPQAPLRLRFDHLATECGWDHMYVYDGDSLFAPLVAAFSGLVVPESGGDQTVPEVVTTSGYALLHFFSDAAYNLTGFTVSYSVNSCPNNCSRHGRCSSAGAFCECDDHWGGAACRRPYCRRDCGSPDRGYCDLTGEKLCVCKDGWQGPDCSVAVPSTEAFWWLPSVKTRPSSRSPGRASHQALVHAGLMWVVGGYSFDYANYHMVLNYDLESSTWDVAPATGGPLFRYGHSLALHQDDMYMFGGKLESGPGNVTDELWVFDIPRRAWSRRTPAAPPPYALEGHTAHVVRPAPGKPVMLVFFGYSPVYGFVNGVLEYNITCDEWSVLPPPDLHADVNRFGHSAVVSNGSMFIFGGFSGLLLNDVLVYTPASCQAFSAPVPCAAAGPGLRCRWLDGACVAWEPTDSDPPPPARFCPRRPDSTDEQCLPFSDCASCTANTRGCQWCEDRKCISVSGNCTVLTLEFAHQHGGALSLPSRPSVLSEHQLSFWKHGARRKGHALTEASDCQRRSEQECLRLTDCRSCSLNANCQWKAPQQQCRWSPGEPCGEGWHHVGEACLRINGSRATFDDARHYCKNLGGNVASLRDDRHVAFVMEEIDKYRARAQSLSPWVGLRKINVSFWGREDGSGFTDGALRWLPGEPSDSGFCAYLLPAPTPGLKANACTVAADGLVCQKDAGSHQGPSSHPCKTPCALRTSCANCTSQATECMWCRSTRRCVDSSAYVVSFPFGQCLEWQTHDCAAQNCSGVRTCAECLERPECGWCGDPADTGSGVCVEGSYRGPLKPADAKAGPRNRNMVLDQGLCRADRGYNWAFLQCPSCQCNGHSGCVNGSVCEHCGNLTAGTQCQNCMAGYYGDPINGGKCSACRCNSHANVCHANTGKCFCSTKGIKGEQCQLCDSENRYLGNPLRGTCYYNLLIDYQFTFSLLQEDDRNYTAINFMATPEQANKNLDMSINASNNFDLNITWSLSSTAGTISGEEMSITARRNIKEHRDSFSCEQFRFKQRRNVTFFIYVSNFSWPVKIQIAFSQQNSIMDLVQFFVTFFSCFLSLLLVAAVVWKVKQTCWASRRREQLLRERQQMASRPFASVAVALEACPDRQAWLQAAPKAIAMEPCWGSRAAVLTVLMFLPRMSCGTPPPGQSGVAIASALADTSSQQRATDFRERGPGLKQRKHSVQHQGTCV
ncbi:attractin-like protein 1 isoform X4 [Syngnathoides biaculeatus]|uniref:attractin-like protein 1 isoform X4 n=1 Tax=Syngnathoides biaculeatus TaxID=300417 RepID=UPI002ADDCD15|nr:attractin-like protein 1 isoform X4 [Syngnathoides biaculeatus]